MMRYSHHADALPRRTSEWSGLRFPPKLAQKPTGAAFDTIAAGQDPEQLLDIPRPLDLEEIRNAPRLRLAHGRVVAVADVARLNARRTVVPTMSPLELELLLL